MSLCVLLPLLTAGCSMSMPIFGTNDWPATTGSVTGAVQVQEPLPQSLAYSDASKIGQAAAAALWQAEGGPNTDWINAATGSSGTLETSGDDPSETCRGFATTVTSIGGVHRYSGKICRSQNGRSVVEIAAPA